ncbi:ras GTPase-activating protein-binding protein 1-like [Limulus polyphemus]|uniref:Ras GTPase-activating protein-binding protein 1-like n=1 Tax=Limulus polyphemus TaxID=6850 RepID=A0ABM1BHA9_LIMPO|nr:ras GTPase-activating protein-binding protein 1-like [Limulus polyphemus]XP_013781996.1 ras GTPase-activating protein-binding protein 1-like [Limulus polyphemus]XP_022249965.1 ras GTPase-activating protein-binding protein 1-like [Limulus polyphemus]
MVMDTPSPQCVGREFVRQYYTVMNKAPLYLHRFYNYNSSFVHGALDCPGQESKPVVGQQAIHQKIMQLNFRDCRAKILQVDSHETLGNGVVVQVAGGLSNNSQGMRPFVQTFVLAPQSPKKYYVRNDIFRYQDDIYDDEEVTDNQEETIDREIEETVTDIPDSPPVKVGDPAAGDYFGPEVISPPNGNSHEMETCPPEEPISPAVSPEAQCPAEAEIEQEIEPEPEPQKSEWDLPDEQFTSEGQSPADEPEPDDATGSLQPEPKTYANMVSKHAVGVGGFLPTVTALGSVDNAVEPQPKPEPAVFTKVQPTGLISTPNSSLVTGGASNLGAGTSQTQRMPRPPRSSFQGTNRADVREATPSSVTGRIGGTPDSEGRKMGILPYPDSQQLFVGNLPHSISEEELKEFFSQYGRVLEMRINTKPPMKMNSGTKVPNFGFIVMDDPADVSNILQKKPIYFNHHRLNVEEKKAKPREQRSGGGGDGRLGGGNRGMMGRGGMGGRFGGRGMVSMGRGDRGGGRGNYVPRR